MGLEVALLLLAQHAEEMQSVEIPGDFFEDLAVEELRAGQIAVLCGGARAPG